ncbi:MAG: ATP-binding cassette domain-containing protein, partial [Succinivibrio sp.]
LIKTMAGIWPHAKGDICVPEGSKSLFLSQRPYLPLGTLRQAVYYPDSQRNDSLAEHYLNLLGLSYLIESLDRTDNWSNMLSLGEQQRIAIIRALILKPDLLFMDEASSALDERIEKTAYTLLRSELKDSLIISVGHRSSLIAMHDKVLLSDGDGKYHLE